MSSARFLYQVLFVIIYVELIFVDGKKSGSSANSCKYPYSPKITFNTGALEIWNVTFTGTAVEVIPPETTKGIVSGGPLKCSVYTFHEFSYYWTNVKNHITFKIFDYFFDKKRYNTFQNASQYGAVYLAIIPIRVINGGIDNPLFVPFQEYMKRIKKPGDSQLVLSIFTFSWYGNFVPFAKDPTFNATVHDSTTSETLNGILVNSLPPQLLNFLSRRQFDETFGSLVDESGKEVISLPFPTVFRTTPVKKRKGIFVLPDPD